jgi:RNA polymerase sigma-54 factor
MALTPKLELRQGQSLVMTPQLQQAIKLLQLSALDLVAYVDAELERNPLLERIEDEQAPHGDRRAGVNEDAPTRTDGDETPKTDITPADVAEARDPDQLDTGLENVYADEAQADRQVRSQAVGEADSGWAVLRSGTGSGGAVPNMNFEASLTRDKTLAEHLSEQLSLAIAEPRARMIGRHLIDLVNEAGYVSGDIGQIAERLGCKPEAVEQVLADMQGFEPSGVMARNLAECLSLQLREKDRLDPAMQALLDNIDLLARHDFKALTAKCKISQEDLADMIAEIRALNPKPGLAFGSTVVQPVVPDVFVREHNDGSWLVELNTGTLPRVLVNQQYYATVSGQAVSDKDKSYISECFADASWLVKSLDQRAKTILKVAREIVRQQDSFLAYGIEHLKPLNLKSIADAIEMHESTVSRVTANKYMATPRGVFELKYFFTSAIASSHGGDAHSAEAVRHRIKGLIEDEAPDKILSDDKIVEILRGTGIDIARRTVAKYRESLRLPSSVERRRQKRSRLLF